MGGGGGRGMIEASLKCTFWGRNYFSASQIHACSSREQEGLILSPRISLNRIVSRLWVYRCSVWLCVIKYIARVSLPQNSSTYTTFTSVV